MPALHEVLRDRIATQCKRLHALLQQYGDTVVCDVTIRQVLGGARGVKMMMCNTSVVDADQGLVVRGRPILELKDASPEDMLFLLLTGELPDEEGRAAMQSELDRRSQVPSYVWEALRALPKDSTPMCLLDTAILIMARESVFRRWYHAGMKREDHWLATLEDSLNIIAKLPVIAAGIYRLRNDEGDISTWTHGLDYAANYANMLGMADPAGQFAKLMRLYLTVHVDHEGGNVSANTTQIVGSALSDPYYAVSAGLNGLAGPLHGLANQECVTWLLKLMERYDGRPTADDVREFAERRLEDGQVIPGYGHAVLRVVDPRYTVLHEFGTEHLPDSPMFKVVDTVFKVVPEVLKEHSERRVKAGKAPIANRWPNVDAISGALVYHFGITDMRYYTVIFAVSRTIGLVAQLILNRALAMPLTRPKSVSLDWLEEFAANKAKSKK